MYLDDISYLVETCFGAQDSLPLCVVTLYSTRQYITCTGVEFSLSTHNI